MFVWVSLIPSSGRMMRLYEALSEVEQNQSTLTAFSHPGLFIHCLMLFL